MLKYDLLRITFISPLAFSQFTSFAKYSSTDAQGETKILVLNNSVTVYFTYHLKFPLDFHKVKAWKKPYWIS